MSALPHEKKIEIDGREITVRDLPWPVMKQFLDRLSAKVKDLVGESLGAARAGTDPTAIGAAFLEKLPELIANSADLAEYLVLVTIQKPALKDSQPGDAGKLVDWLQQRSSTEFLTLLDAAIEVTFNDDFLRLGKAVAGRLRSAFAQATPALTPSRKHVISSSGKDGPSAISSGSPSPS